MIIAYKAFLGNRFFGESDKNFAEKKKYAARRIAARMGFM